MAISVGDARDLLRREVEASSLNAVAKRVGIDRSTLRTFTMPGGVEKPIARVLEPILAYATRRLGTASPAPAPAALAEAGPDGGYVMIPAVAAAYHRGVLDTEIRTISNVMGSLDAHVESLRALRELLGGATSSLSGIAASGVLPGPQPVAVDLEVGAAGLERLREAVAAKRAAEAPPAPPKPAAAKRRA